MMNALRRELLTLLDACETRRKPALRRSLEEGYLYASDLPQAAAEEETDRFLSAARVLGWTAERRGDWILLDKAAPLPPEGWYAGPRGPEAACCLSLLRRRPPAGPSDPAARDAAVRRLLLAGEQGGDTLEKVCGELHGEWAACLREGRALPAVAPAYFMTEEE